jgi:uncharacterized protein (TIGR02421 family)
LEVNARSGLKIQVANRIPLRTRLEKVVDLKIKDAAEGVEVAKTLFSEKNIVVETNVNARPTIGILEPVVLNTQPPQQMVAKIDLQAEKNIISARFFDPKEKLLDITIAGGRHKLPAEKGRVVGADLLLAGKFLSDFYIDPSKEFNPKSLELVRTDVDEKMIQNIDEKIVDIDQQIKLLSYINPRNLAEQKALFLNHPEFSPRFFYRECELDFSTLRSELKRLPREVDHLLFPLYQAKAQELEDKLSLLESVGSDDFGDFSEKVFGRVTNHIYRLAVKFLKDHWSQYKPDESLELDLKSAILVLENFLKEHKLSHWKIKILEDSVSDIQITKTGSILLRKGATFRENRLKALLVHEIGTHIFRFENGKRQHLRIFERGTAGYLRTEEGLAVWNQNQLGLDLGDKYLTPALLTVAIYLSKKMGFLDLFRYLRETYDGSEELAWKLCGKSKRGLKDTDQKIAFTKDCIYFQGLRDVERFVDRGGDLTDLYMGKITIDDLKLVQQMKDLRPAKLLL